ncbi:MAG: SDR family oxidoreductase [Solirubrobacteraceae bacterium]
MHASVQHTDSGPGEGAVLVVGATGRAGRLIVDRLLERDVPVHALVRSAARGQALPAGVRQFIGDVLRPETLSEAMAGATAMVVAATGSAGHGNSAELVDFFGTQNLMERAAAAGLGHVVYVSSIYATRPEHYQDVEPDSLGWKARGEEVVRRSGLDYCIVRAGWLTDGAGGEPLALSQGDVGEGHLSRADLADVCVRVLGLGDAHGKTFEVVVTRDGEGADLEAAVAALPTDAVSLR